MKLNGPIKPLQTLKKRLATSRKNLQQKEKEIAAAEKTYHNEETKVNKKALTLRKSVFRRPVGSLQL